MCSRNLVINITSNRIVIDYDNLLSKYRNIRISQELHVISTQAYIEYNL